jgi:hypothetical protein
VYGTIDHFTSPIDLIPGVFSGVKTRVGKAQPITVRREVHEEELAVGIGLGSPADSATCANEAYPSIRQGRAITNHRTKIHPDGTAEISIQTAQRKEAKVFEKWTSPHPVGEIDRSNQEAASICVHRPIS